MTAATKPAAADPAAIAFDRIARALQRAEELRVEQDVLIPAQLRVLAADEGQAKLDADPAALAAARTAIADLQRRQREIGDRHLHEALSEVAAARRAHDEALHPLISPDRAKKQLAAAEEALESVRVERAALPGRLLSATLAGEVETLLELGQEPERLDLLEAAASRALARARRQHAEAMAAGSEPGSADRRSWDEAARAARRSQAELDQSAVAAANRLSAPVVRSLWQGGAA